MIAWAEARSALLANLLAGACICLTAQIATAQSPDLNISIIVFSPGIPADASTHRNLQVFPKIREFESRLLPFVLRETLVATHAWGAVRVVPEPDPAAELYLSGEILLSDGSTLALHFVAIDASGRVWLDKSYTQLATIDLESRRPASGARAYQALFDEVAHDLHVARELLDDKALQNIVEISLLRYASKLAPTAFEGFLSRDPTGAYNVNRLPARNDPMLERIQRIRNVEYLMTDAVDEKFQELYAEIASTYAVWRKYQQQFAQYQIEEAAWQENRKSTAPRGSYKSIESLYENYKWARLAEQEQQQWATAFNNEVGPTVTRIESRVAELDDWVDNRYAEWNRLLAEIFELETGPGE